MTVGYVYRLLQNNWVAGADGDSPGVSGREHRVPRPTIEMQQDRGQITLRSQDHINVIDGGTENHDPMDLGYQHEGVNIYVDVEVRTSHNPPDPPSAERPGWARFQGERTPANESGSYEGLRGEVQRIIQLVRKGDKEFDVIRSASWDDESMTNGPGRWYGKWSVELDKKAASISPPDP